MKQWRWGAAGLVALLHFGAFVLLGVGRDEVRLPAAPPMILVDLIPFERPEPPPPTPPHSPPPTAVPAVKQGGGAPAAPSVVRPSRPSPTPPKPEVVAPPRPAPEQPLVIGAAPEADSPAPGMGLGGQGSGSGSGRGSGAGPGAGDGPPRIIRGPTIGELRALHPREAFRQRRGGQATLACRVRLDTTLSDCRLVDETPPGMGFGQAALAASRYFRFRPATQNGAPIDGREVRVGVEWP